MIPDFTNANKTPWPVLPPGIWDATLKDVKERFVYNERRSDLYNGLLLGVENLFNAGCPQLFLDGSYVTGKPQPNDYEICWDSRFVNPDILDPIFLQFNNGTIDQKIKYKGEFFPALWIEANSGKPFIEFFQIDKYSAQPKGIIRIVNYLQERI